STGGYTFQDSPSDIEKEINRIRGTGCINVSTNMEDEILVPDTTNPKDLLGVKKVQLGLLPAAGKIYGALAMEYGAAKYKPYNWRDKKIRITVYLDAIER